MSPSAIQSLYVLALVVAVVVRFAVRELKVRTLRANRLWIRPAIMILLTAYLIVLSGQLDPGGTPEMLATLAGGIVLGCITGVAVVRNSVFSPADRAAAVSVRGNRVTVAIWIGALAVRFAARFILPHGADPRAQLPLNCGTVAMAATAFVVFAVACYRAIRLHSGALVQSTASPMEIVPASTTEQ